MSFLVFGVYGILLLFPVAEALLYPGITTNNIGIPPYYLSIIGAVFSVVIRNKVSTTFKDKALFTSLLAISFLTVACLALRYVEVFTFTNYIYSNYGIDLTQTALLAIYITVIFIPLGYVEFFKKHFALTCISFSALLYHIILLSWSHPDIYIAIKGEDGLVETATFFMYLASSILTGLSISFVFKIKGQFWQKKLLTTYLVTLALGLFIIAGEEISWGQRIIGIELSNDLAAINTQGEMNIHNNIFVFGFVYTAYLILNLYGLVSWIFYEVLKTKLPNFLKVVTRLITSRWYISLLFIPNLVYVFLKNKYISSFALQWEEVTELYLAVGILCWMLINYWFLRKE